MAALEFLADNRWLWCALGFFGGTAFALWMTKLFRDDGSPSGSLPKHQPPTLAGAPVIEICFEKRAPYQVSDIQQGRVLSTVRIGIRNTGGGALSNCRVYVEKIAPPPYLPGGDTPRLLAETGFTIRWDDPEKLVDVATHWEHVKQYRFITPPGWFAETLNYIEDATPRTIVIKVEASECQRSASFRISTDEKKALHLDYIGYVS
jgi:hypothetical protein